MKHPTVSAPQGTTGSPGRLEVLIRQAALAATGIVAGQIAHAVRRELPSFEGLDPSGTFGDASRPPLRLLLLGDSTVTAPGLDDADATWGRLVAQYLARDHHVELVSLAEGGAKSRDVLEQQVPAAVGRQWDLAIVSVGSNDVMRFVPVWRFARRLDAVVDKLRPWCRAIILFGVGDIGSIPRLPYPADRLAAGAGHVADWVHRRVAARHDVAKIDQWRLTTAAFNSGPHMFSPDLFHPSPLGHQAWANALIPTIDEVTERLPNGHP